MASSERKLYRSILCPTTGDVLRCSVAFLRGSPSTRTTKNRYSKDKSYLRMEEFLRRKGYLEGSEQSWDKKTVDEKIVLATYLTCEYLAKCDEHDQDILGFETLFDASAESEIAIRNGLRFPFLFPFCLSLLEQDMGTSQIRVVYESYGAKSRASANVFSVNDATKIAQTLFGMNGNLSNGHVWRYAKLVLELGCCRHPQLILGYGCNFRISDQYNRFQYAIVNTSLAQYPIESKIENLEYSNGLEYLDPTLERRTLFSHDSEGDNDSDHYLETKMNISKMMSLLKTN